MRNGIKIRSPVSGWMMACLIFCASQSCRLVVEGGSEPSLYKDSSDIASVSCLCEIGGNIETRMRTTSIRHNTNNPTNTLNRNMIILTWARCCVTRTQVPISVRSVCLIKVTLSILGAMWGSTYSLQQCSSRLSTRTSGFRIHTISI